MRSETTTRPRYGASREWRRDAQAHRRQTRHFAAMVARRQVSRLRPYNGKRRKATASSNIHSAMDGGEAWQLTRLPKGASGPAWSPDGKTLAFRSSTNAEDLAKAACEEGKEKEKEKEKDKDKSECGKPRTRARYPRHHSRRIPRQWRRLSRLLTSQTTSGLSRSLPIRRICPSLDSLRAAISTKRRSVGSRRVENLLHLGSRTRTLLRTWPERHLLGTGRGGDTSEVARIAGSAQSISISRDGSRLAFLGVLNTPDSVSHQDQLVGCGPQSRRRATKPDLEIRLGYRRRNSRGSGTAPRRRRIRPVWSADGKSLTILVAKQGHANLERFDAESGQVTPLTKGDQAITGYSSNGTQMVAEISTPTMINDLFLWP